MCILMPGNMVMLCLTFLFGTISIIRNDRQSITACLCIPLYSSLVWVQSREQSITLLAHPTIYTTAHNDKHDETHRVLSLCFGFA